eukprot:5280884-Pyramimonas_sp.AAC.1
MLRVPQWILRAPQWMLRAPQWMLTAATRRSFPLRVGRGAPFAARTRESASRLSCLQRRALGSPASGEGVQEG